MGVGPGEDCVLAGGVGVCDLCEYVLDCGVWNMSCPTDSCEDAGVMLGCMLLSAFPCELDVLCERGRVLSEDTDLLKLAGLDVLSFSVCIKLPVELVREYVLEVRDIAASGGVPMSCSDKVVPVDFVEITEFCRDVCGVFCRVAGCGVVF